MAFKYRFTFSLKVAFDCRILSWAREVINVVKG